MFWNILKKTNLVIPVVDNTDTLIDQLTHEVPVLPSYINQSIDLLCKYEGNTGTWWVKAIPDEWWLIAN